MGWSIILRYILLIMFLCIFAYTDIKKGIIDNKVLLVCAAAGIIEVAIRVDISSYIEALLGVVIAAVVFILIYNTSKGGIGAGDVKLAICMGGYLGIYGFMNTMFYSMIYTVVFGVIYMFVKHKDKNTRLPFVPFLLLGCISDFVFRLALQ